MNPGPSQSCNSKRHFQLHLFFGGVHRNPRYFTDGCGRVVESWKRMDAFEIFEGPEGALIFVYDSNERTMEDARQWLREFGYTDFLANGSITALETEPEWRFNFPLETQSCTELMLDITSDSEFLRYFADFYVVGPNGDRLGQAKTFCVPER